MASAGTSAALRSPSGPMGCSARAARTAVRTASSGGWVIGGRLLTCALLARAGRARCTSRRRHDGSASGKSLRVWAPRSPRGPARTSSARATVQRFRIACGHRRRRGRPPPTAASTTARLGGQGVGRADDAGTEGHGATAPGPKLRARSGQRGRPPGGGVARAAAPTVGRGPDGSAAQHGAMAPVAPGPSGPNARLGHPGAEDHALEQRVGSQPVGAVHAGARDLADGPQPRQRRRPTGR